MKLEIVQFYFYIIPLSWINKKRKMGGGRRRRERERKYIATFKRINDRK